MDPAPPPQLTVLPYMGDRKGLPYAMGDDPAFP